MLRQIATISNLTFREAIRSKVFSAVLAFVAILVLVATPYAYATIGDPIHVIKNFGLAGASCGSIIAVIIIGSTFLQKELAKRTIHLLLARPLRRWELLAGKFVGLSLVGSVLFSAMSMVVIGYTAALDGAVDIRLLWAIPYGIFEVTILAAVVIFFSTLVVTPILNGIGAFAVFITGRSQEWLVSDASASKAFLQSVLTRVIPDLSGWQVANGLIYNELPDATHAILSGVYAALYCSVLLVVAAGVFQRRDIS